jgi:uncharacterized repeat protein (TIGR03803 family)
VDASGDVYGTTAYGGKAGGGTVFEFAAGGGGETVLHDFGSKKKDGMTPLATPIRDQAGNLYGTTMQGGANVKGTVFKLAPDGHETILYSFCSLSGCTDGQWPYAGLVFDNAGNLYGTTVKGGNADCNCGTVFELSASGVETVLHAFVGGSDGATPFAGLMMDGSGNLFGTTLNGGGSTNCTSGCGTVFEIAEGGSESVIHAFSGTSDGAEPYAGLISDTNGNLYGTASAGGANNKGVIFKIAAGGTESVLYNFCNLSFCADGSTPYGTLIEDQNGNLFGTTTLGGVNIPGTVFELTN